MHQVGGLTGYNAGVVMDSCYAQGSVSGSSFIGGLVGYNLNRSITNCYSTGVVNGSSNIGGLVGRNYNGNVNNSFWDIQTSGQATSDGGTGKTTADMKTHVTFTGIGWVEGKAGNALYLNGMNGYVDVPGYNGIGGANVRTVSLWFKTSTSGRIQILVQWGSDATGQLWAVYMAADNKVAVSTYGGGVYSTKTITDGQWHHIAAVLDEGQSDSNLIRLYVDGVPDTVSFGFVCPINTAQTVPIHLGAWRPYSTGNITYYFQGLMDEVCIYDRVLDASEIVPDNPIPTEGLIAYWAMDETEGRVAHDSVSSYNGVLQGTGWDFTNETANGTNDTWRMCIDGVDYPRLNWESLYGDFACPDGVSVEDLEYFVGRWLMDNCMSGNNYCGGVDMDSSGGVNLADWAEFAGYWLEGM